MGRWSRTQVEQFAPDDKSVKAAQKLARPGPWSETGSTDNLVWGKCQGSGKAPYQVSVDLTGPAAKCTCPSRKFPCKHGIALLMLWASSDGAISDTREAATFAGDWAKGRAEKTKAKTDKPAEPVDPAAQEKRLEVRLTLMTSGAAEFQIWLSDLYRNGFAAARQQPNSFWDGPAAHLLNAQLPGLAQRVRDAPGLLFDDDWVDTLLTESGRWFAAVTAWQRREHLSDNDLANLRVFLGWPFSTEDARSGETITDTWTVEGMHRTDDGRLKSQRTWLRGTTTGHRIVLLDFAAGSAFLEAGHVIGSCVTAPLFQYPGTGIRRALFGPTPPVAVQGVSTLGDPTTVTEATKQMAAQLAINPFLDEVPVCLRVRVSVDEQKPNNERAVVSDAEGCFIPVVGDHDVWNLLALCGQDEVSLFGELGNGGFRPLTVELASGLIPL